MKVNLNQKSNFVTSPSFKGFEHKKNELGTHEYVFNLPYDSTKYDAYLEIFKVEQHASDDKFFVDEKAENLLTDSDSLKLKKGGVKVNIAKEYGISDNDSFGYRYKLVDKYNKNEEPQFVTESGLKMNLDEKHQINLYHPTTAINRGGSALLGIPDSFNAGFVYDNEGNITEDNNIKEKALKSTKTFSNKIGGTLAGIEQKIPELKKNGYNRLFLTPIFTDDSLSSHGYWIKNPYQMSQSLGNINNFESLVSKMFKNGINLVADGAFVNEGLEGVHFKDVLKNGEKSPYFEWFRFSGIENGPLSMGVFSKNQKFIAHKVVNAPFEYIQGKDGQVKIVEKKYDSNKPTYVQIYDKRLVSKKSAEDTTKLIKSYDETNTDNLFEINTHNDTVIPYSFEIRPESYQKNIDDLNEMNKVRNKNGEPTIPLNSPLAARILTKSDSYQLEDKFEGKFETWDANTDIAKINYILSDADMKSLKNLPPEIKNQKLERLLQRNIEAQDFAITAAKYWTRKTADTVLVSTANDLSKLEKNPDKIYSKLEKMVKNGDLPKSVMQTVSPKIIQNALIGKYPLTRNQRVQDTKDLLLSGMMDLPLESIELGDDISAVFGYPQLSKRASESEDVGVSRYLLDGVGNPKLLAEYEDDYSKMQGIYHHELSAFGSDIINMVNGDLDKTNKMFSADNATTFGTYVLPIIGQDIAKFAIIKSLYPDAKVHTKDGKIFYDYNDLKSVTLKDVGVKANNPGDQASELINKVKKGIKDISSEDKKELAKALTERIKNTNATSFVVSDLLLERTQSGLDWRIDATKDIADTDAVRNGHTDFETYWDSIIDFWKIFTSNVREENPNSYFTAEITDEGDLIGTPSKVGNSGRFAHLQKGGDGSVYDNGDAAVNKFLQETGIHCTPNYNYLFTDLLKSLSKTFETGDAIADWEKPGELSNKKQVHELLVSDRHYLNAMNMDALIYSYTFAGNHDKPRALHCLALDMGLFHSDFDYNNKPNKVIYDNDPEKAQKYRDNEKYDRKITAFRDIAAGLIGKNVNDINFDRVSGKAVAMGDIVKIAIEKAIDKNITNGDKKYLAKIAISKAVSDLVQGSYLDESFSPDAFGVKPFDKVIDAVITQATKKYELDLDGKKEEVFNSTFETMLTPAMSKMEVLMKYLVMLPGNPTLYAGDNLGLTGYDEKCKNVYLQNRSFLNWDLLNDKNKEFLKKFSDSINETMALRDKPELAPLNTGAPFALTPQYATNRDNTPVTALLRQNADGRMVVSLFNPAAATLDNKKSMNDKRAMDEAHVKLDSISLQSPNDEEGIKGGIKAGTTFKNIDKEDTSLYKVCYDKHSNAHFIKRFNNESDYSHYLKTGILDDHNKIDVFKSTMLLYSVKNERRFLYNPQYNFVASPYKQHEVDIVGKQLSLCK